MSYMEPRPTKAERRESARAEAAKMRVQQDSRAKRVRLITIVGVLALTLAVIGIVWWVLANAKSAGESKSAGTLSNGIEENLSSAVGGNATDPGAISLGSELKAGTANDGKPVVELYSDFACPHCYTFEREVLPMLQGMAKQGDITLVLHPVAIMDRSSDLSGFPTQAADTLFTIGKTDPDKIIEVSPKIYELWHNFAAAQGKGKLPGYPELAKIAQESGVSETTVKAINSGSVDHVSKAALTSFQKRGLKGTPTLLLNGTEVDSKYWGIEAKGEGLREYLLQNAK